MKPKSVLVIDDDRPMVNLIAAIVMSQGHQPTTSSDVETGLSGFRAGLYDLVISDIFMEGVGGIEGIRQIREIDPSIPIIAVSAGYNEMTPEKAVRAAEKIGADYGVAKPFTPEDMAQLINEAMGHTPEAASE